MYVVSGTGSGGENATIRTDGTFMSGSIDMSVPTESWHHICIQSDGTGWMNNYVDGTAINNGGSTDITGSTNLRIGSYSLASTDFIGAIDEVRISDIARYSRWGFTVNKTDPPFTSDANTILLYHFDNNTEFPPGNSSSKVFSATNYGIDASDYFAWNDPSFSEDLSLPVELTSFTASAGDAQVTLQWQTASEIGNQGFEVLRSLSKDSDYEILDSYTSNEDLIGAINSSEKHLYKFIDNSVFNGTIYWYKIVDVDVNGVRTEHGPVYAMPNASNIDLNPVQGGLPETFTLQQNYPNPFNPNTTIRFDIPDTKNGLVNAKLIIYDITGKKIKTLIDGALPPGAYQVTWNALNSAGQRVPSGIYIYSFQSDKYASSKKMILAK